MALRGLALVFLGLFVLPPTAASATLYEARLYVFVSTELKPRTLQNKLQKGMPSAKVTVFGRFRDFKNALAADPPDAVVAQRDVLAQLDIAPSKQGASSGSAEETYVLVSVGKAVGPGEAGGMTVGSLDLLGRKQMKAFVPQVLGIAEKPKVKLVTKSEDLLPLLHFEVAGAILLPERQVKALSQKSELDLRTSPAPNKVGLPAAAFLTDNGKALAGSLNGLATKEIGVDSWQ